MNRRNFVKNTAASFTGMMLTAGAGTGCATQSGIAGSASVSEKKYDVMKEALKYRKLDAHAHAHLGLDVTAKDFEFMNRFNIERSYVSNPLSAGPGNPEQFRRHNDLVYGAMQKYPGRMIGMFTVNPFYKKESLDEIQRNVDRGMVGLKVYYQYKINDPLFNPIIEKIIDLKMITLMHAEATLGTGGYRMKYDKKRMPNTSVPEDFVDMATRYPEAMLQYAHLGGGPDWEYACKALKHCRNVYVDTSGSNNDEFMVDFAIKELGVERVLYGTDLSNSYFQGVGKVLCSNTTEEQKRKIFFENYNNVLRKSGNHVR